MNTGLKGNKFLVVYSVLLTVAMISSLFAFTLKDNVVDEISAKRLNIIGENGQNVLVLSNKDLFPPPILDGQTFERAVSPGGAVFYNENGSETGGIAMSQHEEVGLRAIVLDYNTMDAIGMVVREDHIENGEYLAGLMINDPASAGKIGNGKSRISLENSNGDARLNFKDSTGTTRLSMGVTKSGEVFFDILDDNGNGIKSLSDIKD